MGRAAFFCAVLAALIFSAGCVFGVYSRQEYGPPHLVIDPKDRPVTDIVMMYGAPDEQMVLGNTRILIYRRLQGMHIMGVFGEMRKTDLVFVARDDKIVDWTEVPKGRALTILGNLAAPVIGPGVLNTE